MGNEAPKTERDIIQDLITKSEEEFEKKITYIGAGALLLSLTLLEKLFKLETSSGTFFLILSWVLLIFSLLINFISHLVAKINLREAEKEIDNSTPYEERKEKHKKRLNRMERLNWTSAIALITGIFFILIFASINTIKSQTKTNKPQEDTLKVKIVNQNELIMKTTRNERPDGKERLDEGFSNPRPQIEPEKKGYTNPTPQPDQGQSKPNNDPPKTDKK